MADKTGYALIPTPTFNVVHHQSEHAAPQAWVIVTQNKIVSVKRTYPLVPLPRALTTVVP